MSKSDCCAYSVSLFVSHFASSFGGSGDGDDCWLSGGSIRLHGLFAISVLSSRNFSHSASASSQSRVSCPRSKHHLPDFDGGSGCACARTMANTGIMGHMGCLRWSYLRFSWRLLCHALWRWWFVGVFPHERLKLIPVIYSVHPLPDSRLIGQIRIFDDLPYTSPMPDSVPRSSSPE